MDWQTRVGTILGTGIIAEAAGESMFSPAIQLGALGVLLTLLMFNYKTANADRKARESAMLAEHAMREKEEAAATERVKSILDASDRHLERTVAAMEKAYGARANEK